MKHPFPYRYLKQRNLKLKNELGVTIILVEHVLRLVMNISNKVSVLNSGKLIASTSPEKVKELAVVKEAYLGRRKI